MNRRLKSGDGITPLLLTVGRSKELVDPVDPSLYTLRNVVVETDAGVLGQQEMQQFNELLRVEEWKYNLVKIQEDRLKRFSTSLPFLSIVQQMLRELNAIQGDTFPGKQEALGKNRYEIFFSVERQTFDLFFNGPQGIRAQYFLDAERGKAATRLAIDTLLPNIMNALSSQLNNQIRTSIAFPSTKIWIHEDESTLNLNTSRLERVIELDIARWVNHARSVSVARLGVQAPQGVRMLIYGAWLDSQNREFVVPSKIHRAEHIHDYGFS